MTVTSFYADCAMGELTKLVRLVLSTPRAPGALASGNLAQFFRCERSGNWPRISVGAVPPQILHTCRPWNRQRLRCSEKQPDLRYRWQSRDLTTFGKCTRGLCFVCGGLQDDAAAAVLKRHQTGHDYAPFGSSVSWKADIMCSACVLFARVAAHRICVAMNTVRAVQTRAAREVCARHRTLLGACPIKNTRAVTAFSIRPPAPPVLCAPHAGRRARPRLPPPRARASAARTPFEASARSTAPARTLRAPRCPHALARPARLRRLIQALRRRTCARAMTAAPQTQSSLTHQAALENAELAELRQRGLRALDSMLRSQHRDAALAVWNLETETLMFANDLYLQLFDIPAMEAARGAITVARFLNTDAVFMHEDTLTQLKITRQCYVRYKRELLAGAMPGHGPRPFLCVTPTGRVQVRIRRRAISIATTRGSLTALQAGDMQIISLPNAEGRVREAIAVVLSHSGRHAASTAAHLPPPLSRTLSMPTPGPIAEPATPAEEEPWRRRGCVPSHPVSAQSRRAGGPALS